eukprot:2505555-Amphidinium_carterae.1
MKGNYYITVPLRNPAGLVEYCGAKTPNAESALQILDDLCPLALSVRSTLHKPQFSPVEVMRPIPHRFVLTTLGASHSETERVLTSSSMVPLL